MLRDRSANRDESTVKRINPEPKLFQRDGPEEGETVRRPQQAWCGRFLSSQSHDDVRELPDFFSAVGQDDRAFSRWQTSHRLKDRTGHHGVRGPGIHEEGE